jgi:tape measure domain-containing protein
VRAFGAGVKAGIREGLDQDAAAAAEGASAGRKWTSAFRRSADTSGGGGGGKGGLLAGLLGGSAARSGLLAGGAAAGAGLFFAVKTGIQQAAANEQAIIGFDTLLPGGAAVADRFFGDLKKFAASTPFELPGLVDAARGLLGVGVSAKGVLPTLTSLGNASAALGLDQERFGRVLLAVNQIIGKGKASGEELAQITEAGIPVWTLLAKATGKPIPELQKLASEGKLLAKDTLPTLFAQMNKDYGGAMTKQSQTLNGVWSTVKDTFKQSLGEALLPLVPVLTVLLPKGAELFAGAVSGLVALISGLAGPAKAAKDAISGIFSGFGKSGGGSALASLFGPLKDFAATVAPPLLAAGRQIRDVLGKAFTDIGKIISTQLVPAFAAFLPAVAPIAKFLLSVFGSAVVGALKGVVNVVKGVLTILAGLFNVITAVLTGDWTRLWEGIKQIVSGAWKAILGVIQVALNLGVAKLFKLGFGLLRGIVTGGWAVLVGIFRGSLTGIGKLITGGWSLYKTLFSRGLGLLLGLARSGLSLIGRAISGGMSAIGRFFAAGWSSAVAVARAAFTRLVAAVTSGVGTAVRFMAGLPGKLVGALGNTGRTLYSAGSAILTGLRDGMFSAARSVGSWISDIGGRIVTAVKNYFGIRSPSTVFHGLGVHLIQGLIGGLASSNPLNIAKTALGGLPEALGAMVSKGFIGIGGLGSKALKALGGVGGKLADFFGGSGQGGLGFEKQMQILRGAFPGLALISGFRPGAVTATGNPSYHASGRAVDVPPIMAVFEWIKANFPNSKELIFTPAGGRQIRNGSEHTYSGVTARDHQNHIHWAYDKGGLLQPGASLTVNRTGRPERILGAEHTSMLDQLLTSGGTGTLTAEDIGAAVVAAFARAGIRVEMDGQVMGVLVDRKLDGAARRASSRRGAI